MNTSDGLTKAMSSSNIRNLLTRNTTLIVTEWEKKEIRKRMPAAKRYIVYPETIRGERIWTLTCDERLERGEVRNGKWRSDV